MGIAREDGGQFHDWDELRRRMTDVFASRTQEEWCRVFDEVDACVTPVLTVEEAAHYPHNVQRRTFAPRDVAAINEAFIPNPAPRMSETPGSTDSNVMPDVGEQSVEILNEIGYSEEECTRMVEEGIVGGTVHVSRL